MNREELAWAAGFYDGEGSTTLTSQGYPRMNIGQVWSNRRTLERFREAVGLGVLYGPYDKRTELRPNNKPQGMLSIIGFEEVQATVVMLWPFLDLDKRNQAKKVLLTCIKASQNGRCRSNKHIITDVGRIDNRCAECYKLKHPKTRMEPTYE